MAKNDKGRAQQGSAGKGSPGKGATSKAPSSKAPSQRMLRVGELVPTTFGGTIYPVNPKRESVLGIKAYRSVADVPAAIDLAVIATPAHERPPRGNCAA